MPLAEPSRIQSVIYTVNASPPVELLQEYLGGTLAGIQAGCPNEISGETLIGQFPVEQPQEFPVIFLEKFRIEPPQE